MATALHLELETSKPTVGAPAGSRGSGRRSAGGAFATRGIGRIFTAATLAVVTLATLFPFYSMLVLSLKPSGGLVFPDSLVPTGLTLDNFNQVLGGNQLLRWLLNTILYSAVSVAIVLLLASMAGYAFAKKRFPGKTGLFWSFIAMLMVPYHVTLIPMFVMVARVGGVDTYWGLIIPTLANAQATFLMRQFIMSIPDELIDAAKVDGASELRIFFQIVIPLCKPILATLGLFVFLWHWNDFLWPLIMAQSPEMMTLTTGMSSMMQNKSPLGVTMAGSVVSLLPIFVAYLFAQRHFTEGATMSGLKG